MITLTFQTFQLHFTGSCIPCFMLQYREFTSVPCAVIALQHHPLSYLNVLMLEVVNAE